MGFNKEEVEIDEREDITILVAKVVEWVKPKSTFATRAYLNMKCGPDSIVSKSDLSIPEQLLTIRRIIPQVIFEPSNAEFRGEFE